MLKKIVFLNIIVLCIFFVFLSVQSSKARHQENIRQEIERIENSASGQSGKGFLSVIKGDNESAIEHFSKSIEIEPNNPIVYHQRGIAYYNLGNYQDAVKDLNQTIKLDPNLIDAYSNRSLVKMELKDYKGALADINEVLKIAPEHPKAIEQKKTILSKMNK